MCISHFYQVPQADRLLFHIQGEDNDRNPLNLDLAVCLTQALMKNPHTLAEAERARNKILREVEKGQAAAPASVVPCRRALLSWLRSLAYLEAGRPRQALKVGENGREREREGRGGLSGLPGVRQAQAGPQDKKGTRLGGGKRARSTGSSP